MSIAMTIVELNAFLAVCRHRNISKAAKKLFVTQASLSARIKALEEDIGCELLIRSKGNRTVSLTAKGQAVYRLALQHEDILSKIKAVGTSEPTDVLQITCLTSVGNYLLSPAFDYFMEKYPHIHLSIANYNASGAVPRLIAGTADISFATAKVNTDQIVSIPILSDPLTLVCSQDSDYPETVSQAMLRVEDEVYSYWSSEAAYWHDTVFGTDRVPYIKLELMDQVGKNIAKPGKWGFVPISMANYLCQTLPVRKCKTTFPLPERTIFLLRFKETAESPNIRLFLDTLREVLADYQV